MKVIFDTGSSYTYTLPEIYNFVLVGLHLQVVRNAQNLKSKWRSNVENQQHVSH